MNKNAQSESLSEGSQDIFIAVWLLAAEQRTNPLPQGYQEGHLKIHIQDGSCPFWQKIAEFIFWYTWALNCYLILEMDWDIITDSWALLPIESAGRTWYRAAVLSGVTSCCKNKVETWCPSLNVLCQLVTASEIISKCCFYSALMTANNKKYSLFWVVTNWQFKDMLICCKNYPNNNSVGILKK